MSLRSIFIQGFVAKKLATSGPEARALNIEESDDGLEAKVLEAIADEEVTNARRKRSPADPTTLLASQVYTYPGSPYAIYPSPSLKSTPELPAGLFYRPDYYYHLGLPSVKAPRQFLSSPIQPTYFDQPTYEIPYVAPGQAVRSDSEEPISDDRSITTIAEDDDRSTTADQ